MTEVELLRAQLVEKERELAEKNQALAQEHLNAALPVADGLAHIFRSARAGDKVAKIYADNLFRELGAYQAAQRIALS